jgi:hypothetical protein
MDKWFKDILPDKDPYLNRGRDQMRKKGGPEFKCLWFCPSSKFEWCGIEEVGSGSFSYIKKDTKSKCRIFLLKSINK